MQTNKLKNQIDPQPLSGVLKGHSLHHIIQKAKMLMAIDEVLREILPKELRSLCRVMNFNQGDLIVETANAAVATRIRYSHHQLLEKFKHYKHLPAIESILIKVRAS